MLSFIPGMSEFGKEEKVKRLKTNPEEEVDVLRRILNKIVQARKDSRIR